MLLPPPRAILLLFALRSVTQSVRSALFLKDGKPCGHFAQASVNSIRLANPRILRLVVVAAILIPKRLVYMLCPARG